MFRKGLLPKDTKIVGYARTKMTAEEFKDRLASYFKPESDKEEAASKLKTQTSNFQSLCSYVAGAYDKAEAFQELDKHVRDLETSSKRRNRLFYLALPPNVFGEVSKNLKENVYPGSEGDAKIIIEKPFGHDLESSRELQRAIAPVWSENEVYRIDHYLGKDMVNNIVPLRFGNQFFNASWNKNNIEVVQILFKEPFGTEGRGGYFDDIGIIRDVMQNHLLQVLTLIGMERPVSAAPEDVRDEKVKVLKAISPIDPKNALLGQYSKSEDGKKPSYLDDETVNPDSKCVTFAALELQINNERWEGVPFVLRAGKALNEAKVEVRIQFKDVAKGMFKDITRNELVLRIQPKEAIYLKMNAKTPGFSNETVLTDMDLSYHDRYTDMAIPEAYEILILDAIRGDHSKFVRDDELDASWKVFTPLLHWIEKQGKDLNLEYYSYGSNGPSSLHKYLADRGYATNRSNYSWPTTKVNL